MLDVLFIFSFVLLQAIMTEIYRALKKFNFEWKVCSPYKIKVRFPIQEKTVKDYARNRHKTIKVQLCLQLYKTPRKYFCLRTLVFLL